MKEARFRSMMLMAAVGAVAALVKTGVHQLIVLLYPTVDALYLQVTAFATHGHTHAQGIEALYSLLSDTLIGAVLGVIAAYMYRCSPRRYWVHVTVIIGLLLWLGSLAAGNLLKILESNQTDVANLTSHLLEQLLFALLVYLGARYTIPLDEQE